MRIARCHVLTVHILCYRLSPEFWFVRNEASFGGLDPELSGFGVAFWSWRFVGNSEPDIHSARQAFWDATMFNTKTSRRYFGEAPDIIW